MNRLFLTGFVVVAMVQFVHPARAAQAVAWAQRLTVDSDGDGLVDLLDNAPGTSNVGQFDTDNDGIGDPIDPTPNNSNPTLGDPGLGMNGPPNPLPPGSTANFDYLMVNAVPPGAFGYIDLDFGGNGTYDATYFGPLTASFLQFAVPANLYVDPLWNLNAPGMYTMHAKAYAPGMQSQNVTITNVTITPEPAGLSLLAIAAGAMAVATRRRGRSA